jgi:hypothetical protein
LHADPGGLVDVGFGGAGFKPVGFDLGMIKTHGLKPALLVYECDTILLHPFAYSYWEEL